MNMQQVKEARRIGLSFFISYMAKQVKNIPADNFFYTNMKNKLTKKVAVLIKVVKTDHKY